MQQMYWRTPMSKCDFNKVALQLYWNHTSAWVFSCKFVAYFQNTFTSEDITAMVGISAITQLFWMTNSLVKMFSLVLQILIISSFQNYMTLKKPQNSFQEEIHSNDSMIWTTPSFWWTLALRTDLPGTDKQT